MTPAQLLAPKMTSSPLVRGYLEQESRWRDFVARNFPDARLLRWNPEHRVFRHGRRVIKVEWAMTANHDPRLTLEYEFSLMKRLEGRALRLNPSYRVIDGAWHALELDWVEGEDLDALISKNRAREVSIPKLVSKLFRVSLAGVAYKQLRARHIFRRATGALVFIDFGHSSHTGPLGALWRNFAPLNFTGGSWRWSRLVGIIREILRHRETMQGRGGDASRRALQLWRLNDRRPPQGRPAHIASHPGDPVAARHFEAMEQCLTEAVETDPRVAVDLLKFQLADYSMDGSRDWGFIWDHLARRVDFAGRSVVDLACGMGGVGAFARLGGANRVVSCDGLPVILDAARNFAEALGFADNVYRLLDWAKLETGDADLPAADIITALSARLDDLPREPLLEILTRYPEILWQTADADAGWRDLAARGYRTVEVLVRADVGQYILYAADREI